MSDTKILATTQYGDHKGNISLDKEDFKSPFLELIKDKNIDKEKYFPLSITFNKNGKHQTINVDTTEVALNYNDLKIYLENNTEPLAITRFSFDMNINEFLEYSKRFSFNITINTNLNEQDIHIIDRVSL